jgi:ATP-dependent DNA helicase RecG
VAWLTGSRKGKERAAMLAQVASGEAALVVGTHAVIQDTCSFAAGLAIIDEQHRFGVAQRWPAQQAGAAGWSRTC